jgi:drug/metabolite transporter (DMT)-like permease
MALVFLLYALFASVFTIAKIGLEHAAPLFFVGSRMAIAGALMLGYLYFFQKSQFKFRRENFWRIVRLAAFNIYLTNAFEFLGLKYMTSFKTCFIYSLCPFLSALFSFMFLSEKMTVKKWIGLMVGFAGVMPVLLIQSSTEEHLGGVWLFSWPEIFVMLAAVCSVYGWVVLRQLVKDDGYSPMMANGLAMVFGGIMALVNSLIVEDWNPVPVSGTATFLQCALLLIIISNFICYNLYGHLLKKYTATFLSFAGWTTPLFTALFGWFVLNEQITWPSILSALIVLAGLLLFYQEELKQGYIVRTTKPVRAQA